MEKRFYFFYYFYRISVKNVVIFLSYFSLMSEIDIKDSCKFKYSPSDGLMDVDIRFVDIVRFVDTFLAVLKCYIHKEELYFNLFISEFLNFNKFKFKPFREYYKYAKDPRVLQRLKP